MFHLLLGECQFIGVPVSLLQQKRKKEEKGLKVSHLETKEKKPQKIEKKKEGKKRKGRPINFFAREKRREGKERFNNLAFFG